MTWTKRDTSVWLNGLKVGFAAGAVVISVIAFFGADGIHYAHRMLKPVASASTASQPVQETYELATGIVLTPSEMTTIQRTADRIKALGGEEIGEEDQIASLIRSTK